MRNTAIKEVDAHRNYRMGALTLLFFAQAGLDIQHLLGTQMPISVVFMVILLLYGLKHAIYDIKEMFVVSQAFFLLWFVYILKGAPMPYFIGATIYTGYAALAIYKTCPEKFLPDLSRLCKWCMYYTFAGVLLQHALPALIHQSSYYRYSHIFGIFWYCTGGSSNGFRFTGLAGEPGIWQFFLALNLLFTLYEKRPPKQIAFSVLSIVFMFSTTGYFNMLFVLGFYYSVIERRIKVSYIIIMGLLAFFLSAFVLEGIMDKLSNSSGLTRISDIFIGWMFLKRSPILGIDPSIADNSTDSEFLNLKYQVWGDANGGYVDPGYLDSGFCSGIMWFVLDYGLPLACYFFYKLFKFPLITDKKLQRGVLAIILLTFMTEPQSRTGWFYFFVLATFIKFNWKKPTVATNGNINYNSNLECCKDPQRLS